MANLNPISFLLNQADPQDGQVVDAPAFSLTKVLASLAVVVTPTATLLVDQTKSIDLHARNYVALAIAVPAFLAIVTAADVLARAIATAASTKRALDLQNAGQMLPFNPPMSGLVMSDSLGWNDPVTLLALANVGEPVYLVQKGDEPLKWRPADEIRITT